VTQNNIWKKTRPVILIRLVIHEIAELRLKFENVAADRTKAITPGRLPTSFVLEVNKISRVLLGSSGQISICTLFVNNCAKNNKLGKRGKRGPV
jgi:hypothetical protein